MHGKDPIFRSRKTSFQRPTWILKRSFLTKYQRSRKKRKESLGKTKLTRKEKRNWNNKEWDKLVWKIVKRLKALIDLQSNITILIILFQQSISSKNKSNHLLKNQKESEKPKRTRKQVFQNKKNWNHQNNKKQKMNFMNSKKQNNLKYQNKKKEWKRTDIFLKNNFSNSWNKTWRSKSKIKANRKILKDSKTIKMKKEYTSWRSGYYYYTSVASSHPE